MGDNDFKKYTRLQIVYMYLNKIGREINSEFDTTTISDNHIQNNFKKDLDMLFENFNKLYKFWGLEDIKSSKKEDGLNCDADYKELKK